MSKYYEDRIKKGIYKTYNSLEERNIELLKFYKQASEDIRTELYKIAEKVQKATNKADISLTDMYRFRRLKALNEKNYQIVEELTTKTEAFGKEGMIEGFEKVYSEASVAVGNIDFALPNEQLMEELLKRPWRGSCFSERLWKNSEKLGKVLNDTLRVGLQQGRTVAQIAIELDNVMQKGFNAAHRLVRTETMHFLNQSSMHAYRDAGITHVMDVVTMDERTSEECAEHNGEIYPIDKAPILPRHPNCRCTLIAVVDAGAEEEEVETVEEVTEVEAKGYTGQTYTVALDKLSNSGMPVEDYNAFIDMIQNHANKDITRLYGKFGNDINHIEFTKNSGNYAIRGNNMLFSYADGLDKMFTLSHEYGHFFDARGVYNGLNFVEMDKLSKFDPKGFVLQKVASTSDEFLAAVRKDKELIYKMFDYTARDALNADAASAGVQDAISGLFGDSRLLWGHESSYYNRKFESLEVTSNLKKGDLVKGLKGIYKELGMDASNQAKVKWIVREYEASSEIWANISAAEVLQGEELKYIKEWLPNSYAKYLEIIGGVD